MPMVIKMRGSDIYLGPVLKQNIFIGIIINRYNILILKTV
jgi:hypothetical protein